MKSSSCVSLSGFDRGCSFLAHVDLVCDRSCLLQMEAICGVLGGELWRACGVRKAILMGEAVQNLPGTHGKYLMNDYLSTRLERRDCSYYLYHGKVLGAGSSPIDEMRTTPAANLIQGLRHPLEFQ